MEVYSLIASNTLYSDDVEEDPLEGLVLRKDLDISGGP
jgi:hypothetical protein